MNNQTNERLVMEYSKVQGVLLAGVWYDIEEGTYSVKDGIATFDCHSSNNQELEDFLTRNSFMDEYEVWTWRTFTTIETPVTQVQALACEGRTER